ncbi:hypothetical protein [Bradyrhizobium sp. YR681]|uniref:hypothetical protein n=1 Tax=Bradyrhizobium sp. YR681 TaxID=1144344 RepID=UPI0012F6E8FA|nr:hypothetical protein [Bradyrhizobium sp. YR681]
MGPKPSSYAYVDVRPRSEVTGVLLGSPSSVAGKPGNEPAYREISVLPLLREPDHLLVRIGLRLVATELTRSNATDRSAPDWDNYSDISMTYKFAICPEWRTNFPPIRA